MLSICLKDLNHIIDKKITTSGCNAAKQAVTMTRGERSHFERLIRSLAIPTARVIHI